MSLFGPLPVVYIDYTRHSPDQDTFTVRLMQYEYEKLHVSSLVRLVGGDDIPDRLGLVLGMYPDTHEVIIKNGEWYADSQQSQAH